MSVSELLRILEEHRRRIQRLEELLEYRIHDFQSSRYEYEYYDEYEDYDEDYLDDEMPPFCEVGLIGLIKWFREWRRKIKMRQRRYDYEL
ncbi:MAG: hypothetical protein DRN81_04815 [Thermoproteota archaeon]|nr:MAG: hypothetical protein DRN81_04815 [Candidatus Korarchaeota archaeon]